MIPGCTLLVATFFPMASRHLLGCETLDVTREAGLRSDPFL